MPEAPAEQNKISKLAALAQPVVTQQAVVLAEQSRIYFDGGCVPNPGLMCSCVYVAGVFHVKRLGRGTNNIAEWEALLWALELAKLAGLTNLYICGDSKLVVEQANDRWRIKTPHLGALKRRYDMLRRGFSRIELVHVRRAANRAGVHLEKLPPG